MTPTREVPLSINRDFASDDTFLVTETQVNADGVHVWPFDPAFPVDALQHSLSGTRPFRMNRHDYFELVYLISGELVWQIQDSFVTQSSGDLFVMTSPKFHRVTERSGPKADVRSLFFDRNLLASAAGSDFEYLDYLFTQASNQRHLVCTDTNLPREVDSLIREIARELPARSDRARLCVRTYVKMILVLLMDHVAVPGPRQSTASRRQGSLDRLKPLFDMMEHNFAGKISTEDAAEIVNMSLSTFRRTFIQITGESFVQYLNTFRIAKAQKLLASTDMPISEVCLEVGFCDQSYFGMIFRRLTQMTPRGYRQKIVERSERQPTNDTTRQAPESTTLVDYPIYSRELMLSSAFESMRL
jgi:AraC-like DNA-binding protein